MPKLKPKRTATDADERSPVKRFERLGFKELKPPSEDAVPKMPKKITVKNNKELGDLMSEYAAWREYAEDKHQRELATYTVMNEEYDTLFDVEIIKQVKGSVTEKKASVRVIPEVKKLRLELLEQETLVDLLASKVDSLNNCVSLLSREITRRGQQLNPRD